MQRFLKSLCVIFDGEPNCTNGAHANFLLLGTYKSIKVYSRRKIKAFAIRLGDE